MISILFHHHCSDPLLKHDVPTRLIPSVNALLCSFFFLHVRTQLLPVMYIPVPLALPALAGACNLEHAAQHSVVRRTYLLQTLLTPRNLASTTLLFI